MQLRANLSLIFAIIAPVTLFILFQEIHIPEVVPFIAFLLCPLIAAFMGHSVLHEQKKLALDSIGNSRLKARMGITFGYAEICFLALILISTHGCGGGRIAANEALAVGSLRLVSHASDLYSEAYPQEGFAPNLKSLSKDSVKVDPTWSIDASLASGQKLGYRFTYVANAGDAQGKTRHYQMSADPLIPGKTGIRHFFVDDTGVIRWEYDRPANGNSQSLQ